MERKEMLSMLLELIDVDNGTITKNYENRNELRQFVEELNEPIKNKITVDVLEKVYKECNELVFETEHLLPLAQLINKNSKEVFTLRDHLSRANNGEEFLIHDKTYDSEFCIYSNDGEYYSFEDILLECEVVEFWGSGKHITIDLWGAIERAKERLFEFAKKTYGHWSEDWDDTMKFETIFLDLEVTITQGYEKIGKIYYNLIFGGETDGKETI